MVDTEFKREIYACPTIPIPNPQNGVLKIHDGSDVREASLEAGLTLFQNRRDPMLLLHWKFCDSVPRNFI